LSERILKFGQDHPNQWLNSTQVLAGLDAPWQRDWLRAAGVGDVRVAGDGDAWAEVWLPAPVASNFGAWTPLALDALRAVRDRVALPRRGGGVVYAPLQRRNHPAASRPRGPPAGVARAPTRRGPRRRAATRRSGA